MTVQVKSVDFRRAILAANRVIERRNTIPALSAVKCIANGSFVATATDLDNTITASIPRAPGDHSEFVLTSAREVAAAVTSAGGEQATLSHDGGKVSLRSGGLSLTASALNIDDFPVTRDPSADFTATLSRDDLRQLARVADAMSTEETRYYLNGVNLFARDATTLRMQATDGHRLYFADVRCLDTAGELTGNITIRRKAIFLLLELAAKTEGGVKMTVGRIAVPNQQDGVVPPSDNTTRVSFSFDAGGLAVTLTSVLIDGTYPDVNRVIPPAGNTQMLFKTADLTRALGAVSGFSKQTRAVKLLLTDKGATVSAAFVDMGLTTSVDLPCEHKRAGFEIGYNGNYLRSVLAAARGEEVVIDTADASSAALIRNPADPDWTGVLMPMRV